MTKHSKVASGCLLLSLIPVSGSSMAFDLGAIASQLQQVAQQQEARPKSVQPNASTNGVNAQKTSANDNPCNDNGRNVGVVTGALFGALLGREVADNKNLGTAVGAGLGGLLGGYIGSEVDRRQCELSRIQKKYSLDMQVTPIAVGGANQADSSSAKTISTHTENTSQTIGLSVAVVDQDNKPQFEVGSDKVLPDATQHFVEIAKQYLASEQVSRAGAEITDEDH